MVVTSLPSNKPGGFYVQVLEPIRFPSAPTACRGPRRRRLLVRRKFSVAILSRSGSRNFTAERQRVRKTVLHLEKRLPGTRPRAVPWLDPP